MPSIDDSEFRELEPQDVREYWEDEAHEFTPWLADEIETEQTSRLEDVLSQDLEVIQTEKRVGKYSVDILAEVVDDGRQVVIENQLRPSNHDHLGKSIAYAAGVDADVIVWIAPKFNDEHRDAIQWLNQNSRQGVDLFAIRLEVWKIGDSPPAVRLNPVEEPSEWQEKAKRSEGELTETKKLQEEFWTEFRNRIEERDTPLRPRKPRPQHWYSNPIGKAGMNLSFVIDSLDNESRASLIITDDPEIYQELSEEKDEIEAEFGQELDWHDPEETRAGKQRSQIGLTREAYLTEEDEWDDYLDWLLEAGEQFHNVFYNRVQRL